MSKLSWVTKACGVILLWATAAVALPAQTFTTLFSFDGTDGQWVYAGLVQGTDGNLYGTTSYGGAYSSCDEGTGCGTVFKIAPGDALTTLYSFDLTDGAFPGAGLVQGTDGSFYGTTENGGARLYECGSIFGCGTVFKITPSGTLTTLYEFHGTDGEFPDAGLVRGTDGNIYGTTSRGGSSSGSYCGTSGCGTVFKITPGGKLSTLYNFCSQNGCTDGFIPNGLVQGTDGDFYGTTVNGGANTFGTVFKITSSGTLTTLNSFDEMDGSSPQSGLVQGTDGNFYGTTSEGGANGRYGTVYTITPSGTLTTLHSFDDSDGSSPNAALVQGTDGNFYGTTYEGENGFYPDGTIFKITPSGTLTTLYGFSEDGTSSEGALVQSTNGVFYGTTYGYPIFDATIFSLSVGLQPFVETQPTSGVVGAAVEILGTNLTGATSVTFNGTATTFTVKSKALITTTVPAGATTGTVQVVTPARTLSSNVPFTVN
jgi:uncharacterized repeat protein (TIGR03803 family)